MNKSKDNQQKQDKRFVSGSGRPIDVVYSDDGASEMPGQFPYTRGIHPTMYRSRLWTMRQYAGFATARHANERFQYLLKQGATGLSVAFDLPTQLGYDSDHPMSRGEVGRVGVAIDSLDDMLTLLDGIPLDKVSTSMTINATAPILLALYVAVARSQGADLKLLRGTIQNDILKEYIARGTYIYPPAPSMRLVTDVIAWCATDLPKWNPTSISGYHIREAGSTAGQEIAFTLANAIAYVEAAIARGLAVDAIAPQLSFFFAVHTDLFEEIAKFRAARRLYARIMKERFGATNPRSQMLRVHAQTGGVTLTAQQPDNNVARVTLQVLAAVLGGVQSLHANAKDEALGLPTEAAAKLAVRTQQVIAHESGAINTVDPVGGSHFVEKLTDDLEHESEAIIKQIDDMGGMVNAINNGWPQTQIEQAAYAFGQSLESGDRIIVGTTEFTDEQEDASVEIFQPKDETAEQVQLLKQTRSSRDPNAVKTAMANIASIAKSSDNLMPAILNAVESRATIGEIADTLREVFGEYQVD